MLEHQLTRIGNKQTCPVGVIIKNDHILMEYRHYKSISVWTYPGGRCTEGETIKKALLREIEEETGINKLEIVDYIGKVAGSYKNKILFLFLFVQPIKV